LRINTNVAALNAHRNMIATDSKLSASLERLSTGLRINKAADDSSGMAIADSLKAQYLGIGQAIRNANDGISIVQTADGALQESINIINTIKTKAIQAASDGQTATTRTAIQNDINKLMEELSVIAKTTAFNGQKLLSGVFSNKKFQIGAYANETASISIGSTEATKMGHITQSNLSLASESGGEVQLTITSAITGEKLTLNKLDIQSNNNAENGMGALADEVNRYASITGINATAIVNSTSGSAIQAGTTGSGFAINGINIGAISVQANDSDGALAKAINGKTAEHGVTAAINNNGTITLTSSDGRAIAVSGSVSDVFGSTNTQMSTQGYLTLTQKGVSQFQINGIGAGATGENITLSGDVTTVSDSVLASGSTIESGSKLAGGTIIGGDAMVESSIASTQLDYELKGGSTLYAFTEIAKGTVLGGSVTVGGDTGDTDGLVALEEDMVVKAGSTLKSGSILGVGTIVTTAFTANSVDYAKGDTLVATVTLDTDVTQDADITLKYSSTSANNSQVMADSTLAAGSQLGAKFEIGATYTTATTGTLAVDTATTQDLRITGTLTFANTSDGGNVIKAGSMLANGTTLTLATAGGNTTWDGPTLLLSGGGTLETGDSFTTGLVTLDGNQVLSEDIDSENYLTTAAGGAIAVGSVLTAGFKGDTASANAVVVNIQTATMANDMTLENGSELSTGSKLLSGSTLGDATYVMGGELNATATDISTYARTELKANSILQSGTILGEGSTIGGSSTVSGQTTLDSDMSLTSGTQLSAASLNGAGGGSTSAATEGTKIEQGTIINQDMTLYLDSIKTDGTTSTSFDVKAGDVLTQDLYIGFVNSAGTTDTTAITLSQDMMLKSDSIVGSGTVLAVNTVNAGTVGLSDVESYKLSDLNVLTQEGAQRAIDIAEAALADLDNTRSGLGSVQNQLVSTISNLSVTKTNIQASESAIRDVDFAAEASVFSKMQLLSQTGSYALAQANAASQNILSLLQ
ncbi:flagellin, partial [Desulfobacterales bacterium HSG17]|nr:flagellin [Desulfobacterales bacterium HSG17]